MFPRGDRHGWSQPIRRVRLLRPRKVRRSTDRIFRVDDAALELHGWGEFAGVLRPLVGDEAKALDGFEVGEAGVGFADDFAIERDNTAVGNEGMTVGSVEAGVFGPAFERGEVRRDQRGDELVLVADERALRDHHGVFEFVFDRLRGDQLCRRRS